MIYNGKLMFNKKMKKPLNIEIGARVRESRERLHMSRETLSELLSISTLFLGYIECGQKGMSTETLIALCKVLNVSADYLLMGKLSSESGESDAARLLRNLPKEFLPLADESLRALVKTIAIVRKNKSSTEIYHGDNAPGPIRVAARCGQNGDIALTDDQAASLENELNRLKKDSSNFDG